jgi:site-specific recombinase XerD
MAIIMRWVEARKQLGVDGRKPLFCTLQGKELKPSYVRTMLVRVAHKAGIEKRVHPHGLRHTHSYELMMEGVAVPVIRQQLGHASLATTDRYLRHIAPKDVIDVMQRRDWSGVMGQCPGDQDHITPRGIFPLLEVRNLGR